MAFKGSSYFWNVATSSPSTIVSWDFFSNAGSSVTTATDLASYGLSPKSKRHFEPPVSTNLLDAKSKSESELTRICVVASVPVRVLSNRLLILLCLSEADNEAQLSVLLARSDSVISHKRAESSGEFRNFDNGLSPRVANTRFPSVPMACDQRSATNPADVPSLSLPLQRSQVVLAVTPGMEVSSS